MHIADEPLIFHADDFKNFREWLCLKIQDITWQGRFVQEFEDFWDIFFVDDISVEELLERFRYIIGAVKSGPLNSWLVWLRNKFICYVFVKRDISIYELSVFANIQVNELATLLRDFFLERYPYLEEHLSASFQISYSVSKNAGITFDLLKRKLHIEDVERGSHDDEIMPTLEITLYDEWRNLLKKIRKKFKKGRSFSLSTVKKTTLANVLFHVRSVAIVVVIFLVSFFSLRYLNLRYERKLIDKISIYEPKLHWLDKGLTFREPVAFEISKEMNIDLDELDKKNSENQTVDTIERDGTESDVLLSSWNDAPSTIGNLGQVVSDYEEKEVTGVRDYRFGRNIVYRVLLQSEDIHNAKQTMTQMLEKYETSQVDNVKPGQVVPGGLYYNLYLPQEKVSRFLSEVMQVKKGIVYESRTRLKNPPGKGRVFIWVKSI